MQPLLLWNNLKCTKLKDINPLNPNLVLNSIFVLLWQSHAYMKQVKHTRLITYLKKLKGEGGSIRPDNGGFHSTGACTMVFLFFFILLGSSVFAQEHDDVDPMPVKVKGQVLNLEDETPVPNAIVMNMRTKTTISADLQGRFMMDALNIDSLSVSSLGYTKGVARIPANYNEMNVLIVYLKPVRFSLPDVNVQGTQKKVNMDRVPVGKKNDLPAELRGDAFDKKPPAIAAVLAPASFLQYHLSKSEKEKRETRKAILSDKQWETISQFYNKDLVIKLTGINSAQADYFMMYINGKGLLSQMRTEYDVRNIIKEQFKLYTAEGH